MTDAIDHAHVEQLPTIVVTWDKDQDELGQCRRIAGVPIIYLNVGTIVESTDSPEQARQLISEVLTHELGHARLTCSDADHAVLPRAKRLTAAAPALRRMFAWEAGYRKSDE
jgi:hypothetical protein